MCDKGLPMLRRTTSTMLSAPPTVTLLQPLPDVQGMNVNTCYFVDNIHIQPCLLDVDSNLPRRSR
ncbi:hypothetical protein Y033_3397 [Burkholderia pseudomallei MSHR435]|nr:hypothetical protein X976_3520 [Burkholderia pseudomallei MSHR7500]KGW41347.1 hypothetical protein Y597_4407 [Burkholderia pseudomallei MSHR1000]KGX77209.1 hypothetical protein Y033_3397 [Burkholderia pseudomallei MSHR435]